MFEFLSVQIVEIAVGIAVALILLGGSGAYIAYRLWSKKHGRSACDGNCAHCAGCHVISLEEQKEHNSDKEKESANLYKEKECTEENEDRTCK